MANSDKIIMTARTTNVSFTFPLRLEKVSRNIDILYARFDADFERVGTLWFEHGVSGQGHIHWIGILDALPGLALTSVRSSDIIDKLLLLHCFWRGYGWELIVANLRRSK